MKTFDLNKSSNLGKLKEELNRILEDRIEAAKLNEEVSSLGSLPFGDIVSVFEGISDKLYETKGGKKLIGKYVNAIRENKSMADAFCVYEIVRKSPNVTNPQLFLSEALSIANKISLNEYIEGKERLADVVKECVNAAGIGHKDVNEFARKNNTLNEAVEYLLLNKKSYSNLPAYVNKFDIVCESLKNGMQAKSEEITETGDELVNSLNEEISGLKEWETDAVKEIAIALLAESDLGEIFNKYKTICCESIDSSIEHAASVEEKSHFESMKSQLLEKEYKEASAYEDIFTLAELAETLKD